MFFNIFDYKILKIEIVKIIKFYRCVDCEIVSCILICFENDLIFTYSITWWMYPEIFSVTVKSYSYPSVLESWGKTIDRLLKSGKNGIVRIKFLERNKGFACETPLNFLFNSFSSCETTAQREDTKKTALEKQQAGKLILQQSLILCINLLTLLLNILYKKLHHSFEVFSEVFFVWFYWKDFFYMT